MQVILDSNCCVRMHMLYRGMPTLYATQSNLKTRMMQQLTPGKTYLWPSRYLWIIRRVFPLWGGARASPDASVLVDVERRRPKRQQSSRVEYFVSSTTTQHIYLIVSNIRDILYLVHFVLVKRNCQTMEDRGSRRRVDCVTTSTWCLRIICINTMAIWEFCLYRSIQRTVRMRSMIKSLFVGTC